MTILIDNRYRPFLSFLSDRQNWAGWQQDGSPSMLDRAVAEQERILREHRVQWLDEAATRELDRIVAAADRRILRD